jgi:cobalt-zinc-cadmium efflux system outer membrane protein
MQKLNLFCAIVLSFLSTMEAKSQTKGNMIRPDTIYMTIDSVENIFLLRNLSLLAERYNMDAQKALVIQAKLFPNPTFNFGTIIYQTVTKQFFPVGSTGEISAGISQVILLANKHNRQLKIAETNSSLEEWQFYDLLRTLKHTLRLDFFNVHYLLKSAKVYNTEIDALQHVSNAFVQQKNKGYVSEKEEIRIKAQLYSLESEYNDLNNQINDLQSELRLMLQAQNVFIIPKVDTAAIAASNPTKYPISTLIDSAYAARPDLKMAKLNVDLSTQNYYLQKAMAVPDLTLQFGYDQQGSYIHNLATAGISIDLPFLNRNQGNIKSSKALIKSNQATMEAMQAGVEEQIYNALQKAINNDQLIKSRDTTFETDFSKLLNGVLRNYQERNISLLDFLDFYDSYKENALQSNSNKFNLVSSLEDLNYYTGVDFFNK